MASTLSVPLVQQPVYPYTESPPFDDIMSLLIDTTIVGVLILELPLMSLLSLITYSLGFLVISFGLFLMYIPFLLKDVHFCTLSSLMLLLVSLPFLFDLLLRFIGVVQNHMVYFPGFHSYDFVRLRVRGLSRI